MTMNWKVYGGRTEFIEEYLNEQGFPSSPQDNPADWMIDVVCGLSSHCINGVVNLDYNAPEDLFTAWERDHKADADTTPESQP